MMNRVFTIILLLTVIKVYSQDTLFIDLDYRNKTSVFASYDNDFKDTLYIPNIEFKDYKYRKQGVATRIYKNGKLMTLVTTKSDSVFTRHFYSNGKLRALNIEGLKDFTWYYKEYYYSNGQLWIKMPLYDSTIVNIKEYWPNGNIKEDAYYYGGMYFGPYKCFYENGQLKEEGQFRDFPKILKGYGFLQTTREGLWRFYDETGNVVKTQVFNNEKFYRTK